MADVISRLKLESGEFDSKIKRAAQGIQRMAEECHNAGGILNQLEDENRAYIQSLGSMATVATTAKGKLAELTAAFTDIRSQYNALSDEEKQGEFGQELNRQLEIMKGRINDAKTELSDINKELGNTGKQSQETGGFLDKLKDRFVVNLDAMKLFELGLKAAEGALNVMKDAFFSNEVSLDAWGRTVAASESLYKGFLDALNTGDISGYLANMGDIVTAAQNAYNAIDDLNTFNAFNRANRQRFRAGFTNAVADFREGKGSKESVKSAAGAYIGNLREEQSMQYNAYMQSVNNIAKRRSVDGFALMAALGGNYGSFNALKHTKVSTKTVLKPVGNALVRELAYAPANKHEQIAYAVQRLNDDELNELQGYAEKLYSLSDQANSVRKQAARVLNGNSGGGRSGGRKGGKGGRKNPPPYEPQTQVLLFGIDNIPWWQKKNALPEMEKGIRGGMGMIDVNPAIQMQSASWVQRGQKNPELTRIADTMDESAKLFSDINGGISSIVTGVEALGIEVPEGLKKILNMVQGVTTILSGISSLMLVFNAHQTTDTLSKIASVLEAAAKPQAGAAAAGAAAMHRGGVVRAATGTVVPGNYGFDAVPALLTSGETVLTRAQAGNIASQLQQGSRNAGTPQARVSGEQIYLVLTNYLKRRGQGETLTF